MQNRVNKYYSEFEYKVRVDTLKVARSKLGMMIDSNGNKIMARRFNLGEVHSKLFPGKESKMIFDYNLLQKDVDMLSSNELELIRKYTLHDIKITKNVFEQFIKQFNHGIYTPKQRWNS